MLSSLIGSFYKAMGVFVENPSAAFRVAAVFGGLLAVSWVVARVWHRGRIWPMATAGSLWGLYGLYEMPMVGQGYAIRVDLLLVYPILALGSVVCLAAWILTLLKPPSPGEPESGAHVQTKEEDSE